MPEKTPHFQGPKTGLTYMRLECLEMGVGFCIRGFNVTMFDSVPGRIGAGLTQCTFSIGDKGKPSRMISYIYFSLTHISQRSQISQFCLNQVTDVTDLTDLTDLTQLTSVTKKGWISPEKPV